MIVENDETNILMVNDEYEEWFSSYVTEVRNMGQSDNADKLIGLYKTAEASGQSMQRSIAYTQLVGNCFNQAMLTWEKILKNIVAGEITCDDDIPEEYRGELTELANHINNKIEYENMLQKNLDDLVDKANEKDQDE